MSDERGPTVANEPQKSSEDAAESGARDDDRTPTLHPPEGEQERSAESEETLSPDEKSTG
jgi:hypothetical protein